VVGNQAGYWAGGIYLRSSPATVSENVVSNNSAERAGGVYVTVSDASFVRNTVSGNEAVQGGGLYVWQSGAHLEGNAVLHNEAYENGGGLWVENSEATLSGNLISDNRAGWDGAGMYVLNSPDAVLQGNEVAYNEAERGGGLYLQDSAATLLGNAFRFNAAEALGGGLYLYQSDARLSRNRVAANDALEGGGGLYLQASNAVLTNTMVVDNGTELSGSGLTVLGGTPRLLHTTIARNGAPQGAADGDVRPAVGDGDGSGIYVAAGSVVLTNTILVRHSVGIYIAVEATASLDSTLWGAGTWANDVDQAGPGIGYRHADYTGDPAFVNPDAGNYHIGWASAARDRGADTALGEDIDGQPRPIPDGGTSDLGADEHLGIVLSPSRKLVSAEQVGVGELLTYTVVLLNEGSASALDTVLFDTIPISTTYVPGSAQATSGELTGSGWITNTLVYPDGIRWTGTLVPHQPITVSFQVTVGRESAIENTAVVTDHYGTVTTLTATVNTRRLYMPLVLR
jgi:uncharacterized repeat protein (TIGR01451 family)